MAMAPNVSVTVVCTVASGIMEILNLALETDFEIEIAENKAKLDPTRCSVNTHGMVDSTCT